MSWTEKYVPKKVEEVIGQKKVVEQVLKWYNGWEPKKKSLLFHGPPGVGKTCLIEAFGKEKNLDIIELNASNYRTAKQIREVIGKSIMQKSLFKKGKIFLIDEIDGISGKADMGGVAEIIEMIKESHHPIVLTANDIWNPRIRSLHNYSQLIQFGKIPYWNIVNRLQFICKQEGIRCDNEVLRNIAKRAEGDLRAAINDLEMLSEGKKEIELKDLEALFHREREMNIFDVLKIIFKTRTAISAKLTVNNIDKDPEEIFWWIEQNITNEYEKPEEIARAFDVLSKADLFKNRIRRRQEYKFLKYMIDLMTAGVAVSKKDVYKKFSKYQYPTKIKILSQSKQARKEDKERLLELSKELHCSTRKVRSEFLPYLKVFGQ